MCVFFFFFCIGVMVVIIACPYYTIVVDFGNQHNLHVRVSNKVFQMDIICFVLLRFVLLRSILFFTFHSVHQGGTWHSFGSYNTSQCPTMSKELNCGANATCEECTSNGNCNYCATPGGVRTISIPYIPYITPLSKSSFLNHFFSTLSFTQPNNRCWTILAYYQCHAPNVPGLVDLSVYFHDTCNATNATDVNHNIRCNQFNSTQQW
jgi:hypothetical protein